MNSIASSRNKIVNQQRYVAIVPQASYTPMENSQSKTFKATVFLVKLCPLAEVAFHLSV